MSKFSTFFLIAALALGLLIPTNTVSSRGLSAAPNVLEPFCGNSTTVRLLTEKNVDAGTVTVANGETTLFVTYTTKPNYKLTATHLAVTNALADIPVTSKKNPIPGQFPYQTSHNNVSSFTDEIPLNGLNGTVYVAAHADVLKTGATKTEGAWGEGTPFVPGKRSWGMYFTYAVQPCNEPPTAVDDTYSVDEDNTLNVAAPGVLANDSDPDSDPITAVLVSGPANGTLTLGADGSFSYTPNADFNGTDSFTYKANDGSTDSNVATVNITVNPINDAPVATNDTYSVDENSVLNVAAPGVLVNDTDVDGDSLLAMLVTGPAHGTLAFSPDGSFTYTPNSFFHGSDSFTYKANDGTVDSNVATVNISVDDVNFAPIANDDAYSVGEDNTLNVAAPGVLANDTDPDSDPITAVLVSGPANGTVALNTDGSFSYTPDANFNGTDSFTYKANDGALDSNVATVTITVTPVNDAPVAVDDAYSTDEDTALNVSAPGVLANDTDVDGDTLNAVLVSGPAHGTLTLNADGSFTYAPEANYNGSDSFTYKANDGALDSNIATVDITVNPVNDTPVATDDAYNTIEDTVLNVPAPGVLANDTDVDGDSLSAILVSGPAHGSLTLNPDGSFTYTPDADYNGSDSFTYKASDGQADSNVATVTITITPPNAAPVAAGQSVSTNEDTLKTITLSATDAEGDTVTFSIVSGPSNGSLGSIGAVNCAANTCTVDVDYTPALNFNGSDSFTFKANDGQVDSNTATVDITINAVNDAPSFTKGADQTVLEDSGAQTVNGWATAISPGPSNESGQTVSFNITGNTNAALFSAGPAVASNGDLTYTPAPDAFGSATITLEAQDNDGTANGGDDTSASQTFVINVTGINDAPSFTKGADQTVDEDAGPQSVPNWATGISAGPNEGSQTLTFIIDSNNNPSLFSAGPAVASNGTLTYTPAANQNGVANITLHVQDNGSTANGGVDSSATQSFVITVNAVNDAPVAQTKTASAHTNMKIVGVNPGLLTGVTDADSGVSGCNPSFTVASITSNTGGTVSNVNLGAGTFDFDPNPGFTGTAVVNYTVQDNGCPGTAISAPAAINITVSGPVIWFVNASVAGPGTGTLADPFKTLASADAVDLANHRIFLYSGTYANGITLNSGEWLIGQGVSGTTFDALFGITPPTGTIARPGIAGTRPTIQGNVAMATSDVVRGLNIQPTSGTQGLSATSATSLTVNEVSITTLNAAAVNLASSGGTISLTTVNANGGSRGIVLNGTTGTFTVTGTGGTCTEANTSGCSGGVIQNMTGGDDSSATPVGTGIVLNNAAGVSLTRMYIHDHSNYGIRGTGVNGFTLDNSVVSGVNGTNVSSPFSDGSISFDNLSGTSAITNSAVSGGFQRNIRVDNTTGTLTLTINNNSIHNTGATFGDDGVLIEVGGGNATLNVTNNTFAAHGGDHLNVSLLGSPTVDLTFSGNFWSGGHAIGLGQGLFILGASFNGTFTYDILNNGTALNPLVGNRQGGAMHVNKGSGTGTFSGTISNNFIGNAAVNGSGSSEASGIDVEAHGAGGSHTVLITNNQVRQFHNDGILVLAGEGNAAINVTMTGNTVSNPDASNASFHGVHFNIGTIPGPTPPADALQACLDVRNNTLTDAANEANGGVDLRMRQRQLTTVRLPGYAGANNDNTAVQNFLIANGNALTTILASNTVATGGGGFVGGAACATP